jgi:hypothetical protein
MNGDKEHLGVILKMSFPEMEHVEESNLELHKKALDLLLDYYEVEQWLTHTDASHILLTINNVISEVRQLKTHLVYSHEKEVDMETLDFLDITIKGIQTDEDSIRKLFYGRFDVGD